MEVQAKVSTEMLSANIIAEPNTKGVLSNNNGSAVVNSILDPTSIVTSSHTASVQDNNVAANNSVKITGTMSQLTDQIDANTTASDQISVDLFSPPFGVKSTEATVMDPDTLANHLEFTKIAADSTTDAQNQVNDATDNCTAMSNNISKDLVSPPLLECTTVNEKKRLGANMQSILCTPKHPKIICFDNFVSSNLRATENESSSNSFNQEPMMSSSSSLNFDNTLLKKLSSIIPYPH
jgi:hypothetical protein